MPQDERTPNTPGGASMDRRHFFKLAGAVAAASALTACDRPERLTQQVTPGATPQNLTLSRVPYAEKWRPVPYPPAAPPEQPMLRFFTPAEARTVEAITARLLPGNAEDPGAREAGVVYYIDGMLAQTEGFNQATYREPPFAQPYEGNTPPANQFGVIWVPADQIERYGFQSVLTPREVFRIGVDGVNRLARTRFGRDFADLTESQQDAVVGALLEGGTPAFSPDLTARAFFHTLRRHTSEGMFADPVYGGNRDMVGWRLVGYPGAQRAYTPTELVTEDVARGRPPIGLTELARFHPGQPANAQVALPVRGSEVPVPPPPDAVPHSHGGAPAPNVPATTPGGRR